MSKEKDIKVDVEKGGWIKLEVKGDIEISYPLYLSDEEIKKSIDDFCADLYKALKNERISDLT